MKKQRKYKMTVSIFLLINLIVLIAILYLAPKVKNDNTAFVFAVGLCLFVYIFVWFVPTALKEVFAHWRVGSTAMESRVFTHVKDSELLRRLTEKYGELPVDHKKQKEKWEQILSHVHEYPGVFSKHLWAFISRDIAVCGFLLFLVFITGASEIFLGSVPIGYIIYLGIQYVALVIVARQAAHKFVIQVLESDIKQ